MIPLFFFKKPVPIARLKKKGLPGLVTTTLLLSQLSIFAYCDPILDKAASLLREGRPDAASSIYSAYLKAYPTSLASQLALANIAMRRFEYAKARGMLEATLSQHPDSGETAATLGRLFQLWINSPSGKVVDNSRDYRALAEEHFKQAMTLSPQSPLVLTNIADWELQQNDLITTEKYLQQALKTNPTYIPAFQGLTRYYIKVKDLQRAKNIIFHATDLDPTDPMNYFLTAQLLGIANRPVEAVKYGLKSEQLDYGRLPERDYFLATQYDKLGESAKAVQYFENLTRYTPREPQVWLKLGELYETLKQPDKSLNAFQHAVALKPDILDDLYAEARQNTRTEKSSLALKQWRRLLTIQADKLDTVHEGISALASLHYLNYFYHPGQPDTTADEDVKRAEDALRQEPKNLSLQLDCFKLRIARQGEINDAIRQALTQMVHNNDSAIAGEAAFLLDDLAKTRERLEEVDGLSDTEYAQLADRLMLAQELQFSKVFYQRAFQLKADSSYQTAMKRIQSKQNLAKQKLDEGNLAFNDKHYQDAVLKYLEAIRIDRQMDSLYLRLGDTYEALKKWPEAKEAYDKAISLSPGLLNSQGFAKNYHKIRKKVGSK